MLLSLVLASNNAKKVAEFTRLFDEFQYKVVPQGEMNIPSPPETGLTFVENALLKARHASAIAKLPALADDSGLVVDALDGAPGIYSARFAGPDANDRDNNRKLLATLTNLATEKRSCHYHCSLVLVRHAADPDPLICQGRWHGTLLTQEQGTGGFGYDPLFWIKEQQCSVAELDTEAKNQLSHRGIATRLLVRELQRLGLPGEH